ncbi:MAG: XRE family transcriptional regulator [Sneathiella sp.]|nr:MAG: XRE family transcriptional regulator [Sneathiella sp.]
MQDPTKYLAKMLKTLRKEHGLSLDGAATKTGISKAMLGQIERGESSPTTATLWKIATGFNTSISSLTEPIPEGAEETLIRDADEVRQLARGDGTMVAPLFPYEQRFGFEYMELTFLAGFERLSEAHEPGVVEYITVISGSMEVFVDDIWHDLQPGKSIRFRGDKPHGYRNKTDEDTVTLSVIHYPRRP